LIDNQHSAPNISFSAQFLQKFSDCLHHSCESSSEPQNAFGLLFGNAAEKDVIVQNFRSLPADAPSRAQYAPMDRCNAFETWRSASAAHPELMWLDLLGWFCLRLNSKGELLPSDVDFHNAYFNNAIAAIFHTISGNALWVELYASVANLPLGIKKHHHVTARVSLERRSVPPAHREKRMEMPDELFLRAYEITDQLDQAEGQEERKKKKRSRLLFRRVGQ
jgi:hypothetical protein